jgi:hypothetical protein
MDQLGNVHFKGVIAAPSTNPDGVIHGSSTPGRYRVFRLPTAYRPETGRIFATVGAAVNTNPGTIEQEAAGRVDVEPTGVVVVEADCGGDRTDCSANGPYFTLDGISFRPDE